MPDKAHEELEVLLQQQINCPLANSISLFGETLKMFLAERK